MATEQSPPTSAPPIVSVRGETIRRVDPEIALASITVSGRDRDKAKASRLCATRQKALTAVLDQFAPALERAETSRVSLYATYASQRRDRVDAWIASVTCSVVITDLDAVGPLLAAAGAVESATLSGPDWQVRPTSPLHREARLAAIGDALARASDYAAAVGARVTSLIEVADQGMSGSTSVVSMSARMPMFARGGGGGEPDPELDVIPQQQEIRASVEVRVAISVPTIALHTDPA